MSKPWPRTGALLAAAVAAAALSGCASAPAADHDTPIPASIGAAVRADAGRVVVVALSPRARAAGLRTGDVIVGYNGSAVQDARQFARLVIDSRPGSVASVEVLREGARLVIPVVVREIDTAPSA
jgi:serine protease Do